MEHQRMPRKVISSSLAIAAILIAGLALSACSGTTETETSSNAPAPAEKVEAATETVTETVSDHDGVSQAADGDLLLAHGQFEGLSQHVTTGGVTIVKRNGGVFVELATDFSLDGAPDPVLGFGKDGEYVTASQFSALENISGAQSYKLPEDLDPASYDTVYVWCEKFSVPLGVASLSN